MSFGDFGGFWVSLTDESGVRQAREEFFPPILNRDRREYRMISGMVGPEVISGFPWSHDLFNLLSSWRTFFG